VAVAVAVAAGEEEAVASGEEEGLLRLRELFSAEGLGAGGAGGGGGVGEAARSSPAAVAGGGRPSKRSSDAMDFFSSLCRAARQYSSALFNVWARCEPASL
jgi:hypothetical protein